MKAPEVVSLPKPLKCSLPPLLLNVPALAGGSETEVSAQLGPPAPSTDITDPSRVKRSYTEGKVEVVFVEGRAGWIKLYPTGDLPFSPDALAKLGLPIKRPTYVNRKHVISWHNLPHLREVSLYGGGPNGSVSSVLICVQTGTPSAPARKSRRFSLPRFPALHHT